VKANDLFKLPGSLPFGAYFKGDDSPWEWVSGIKKALDKFDFSNYSKPSNLPPAVSISGNVIIDPSVKLPSCCVIEGPAYISANTEIRAGAYIRGNVIVGEGCVLGHSCEYKNCLLMDRVKTAHFNYIGDSILGSDVHFGAGAICANLRLFHDLVPVNLPDGSRISSQMLKLGALLGERSEVLCNSVLQPGTILGKNSVVLPGTVFSGYLSENTIVRSVQQLKTSLKRN
jgi:NDP-sugar pyrophosphorylase family protein